LKVRVVSLLIPVSIILPVIASLSAIEVFALRQSDAINPYLLDYAKVLGAHDYEKSSKLLTVLIAKLRRAKTVAAMDDPVVPLLDNAVAQTKRAPLKEMLAETLALRARIKVKDSITSALTDTEEALELSPENPEIRLCRALALHRSGKKEEALKEIDRAISLKPSWHKPFEERALILRESGITERANIDASLAAKLLVKEQEQSAEIRKQITSSKTFQARLEAAQRLVALDPRSAASLALYSQYCLEKQDYESAIAWAELAKTIKPSEYVVYNVIGIALIDSGRGGKKALQVADEGVSRFPDSPVTLTNRAAILFKLGEPERALLDVNRALQIMPSFGSAYFIRSMIYANLNRGDESISDARVYLKYAPKSLDAYQHMASLLAGRGKLVEAYKLLSENLHISGDCTSSRFNMELLMGKICSLQGDHLSARKHFAAANKISNLAKFVGLRLSRSKNYYEEASQSSYMFVPNKCCSLDTLESLSLFGLTVSPGHHQANYLRALVLMCRGKSLEASSLFLNICEERHWQGHLACQSAILAFLCLERAGKIEQGQELLYRIRKVDKMSYYHKKLLALFLGEISQNECLRKSNNRLSDIRTQALIAFHLASNHNTNEALPLLSAVTAEGEVLMDESLIAASEERRLHVPPTGRKEEPH